MNIKVLGTGCKKCKDLVNTINKAIEELNIEANIEKVEDIQEIMSYGIMSTPGLIIDGEIVSTGRGLNLKEVTKLLKK